MTPTLRRLSFLALLLAAASPAAATLVSTGVGIQADGTQVAPAVAPESLGMSAERLDRLRSTFEGYVSRGRLAGAVVLVWRRGEPVFVEAFGHRDREAGDPQRVDDVFRIASQSKAIVSVAVMMLQEEGRLSIGDPVARYLPEFAETTVAEATEGEPGYRIVPAERPITIRDLLTHTAGVGYGYGPGGDLWQQAGLASWYFADLQEPIRESVRRMAALPFPAQPGAEYVYGYSTDILGALVEVVSGYPLDEFLRTWIFEPLAMADTHFYLPPAKRDRLAVVYSAAPDGVTRAPAPGVREGASHVGQGHYIDGPRASFSGGAGLVSTARDYARFLQMLLNGGELDGVRLLSPKTVQLMTVNHVGDRYPWVDGAGFGLGFEVVEDLGAYGRPGSVGAFGWGGAYHSTYWVDPAEELVVVYLTQLLPAGGLDDHARLRALVYQAIVER